MILMLRNHPCVFDYTMDNVSVITSDAGQPLCLCWAMS